MPDNPQPSAPAPEPEFAAFVAIDWADQKHYWKLASTDGQHGDKGELRNTPEALDMWAAELNGRFQGRPIAVCLEQSRGPLVYQLRKHAHLVLYPVHPTVLARYREAFFPSGSKADPGDTGLLLEILQHHRDRLRRLDPDTPETRLLQMLVEQRRRLVDEKTRESNRLTAWLKMYFPQVLNWIDDIDSPLGCDLLEQWPTLEELRRAHPGTLHRFFVDHNSRSEERIQERIQAIYQATPAITDTAMLQAGPTIARGLVALLKTLHAQITQLDQQIEQLVHAHPETPLYSGLPGAGPVLLPRLVVAFGTQRERYGMADAVEAYSGIAPVTKQSGHTRSVSFRRACPKFLRQTFHEFAAHSLAKSVWARAYYDSQKGKGKGHHAAVRAVAFKWIRILFRCWKNRTPYDEATYLRALQQRHSPLAGLLGPATKLGWKEVSGFQKLSIENT